ncbi:MAG: GYD domain-containing protein [Deltaproteobacteria bacterium]|nr:GYD domain-containing protein [Deltaproteobacteria bacterium]
MAIYVSFLKKTPEGNKDIKNSRERYAMGRKSVEAVGGKILAEYYIVARGEYMIISEFPDEQARVKSMVNTVQRGTVNYEVYRMLPVDEFFKLVEEA